MSEPTPDEVDPIDAPYDDDSERAEVEWLNARETDPSASPPSAEVAAEHDDLEGMLSTLPDGTDDGRWQAAVIEKMRAKQPEAPITPLRRRPSPWVRWTLGAGALAAAGLVVYLAIPSPSTSRAAPLEVSVSPGATMRGAPEEVHVGDQLVVTARPRGATELRVYRGRNTVVARCPGPGCAPSDRTWHLELPLEAPVRHQVILVFGETKADANATLDDYLAAAYAAKLPIEQPAPIDVR